MSYGTYSTSQSQTFTVTHARHIAIKIGTDLKRMQRFYGEPNDDSIDEYEREAIALLRGDFLDRIEYGFTNNGGWRIALKYEARYGGVLIVDDDPGGIRPGVDISDCRFLSFLFANQRWAYLSPEEQDDVYREAKVTFRRTEGEEPSGNWNADRVYSAGGRGVQRSSLFSTR